MQPVITKTVAINKDGRITIPKQMRDLFKTKKPLKFKMRLLPDCTIELVPMVAYSRPFFKAAYHKLLQIDADQHESEKSAPPD
jgi:bifunctional DNA-binding transcriptional regulator/antitoxin component of YhaV-PrlF toxin-antitoxin module